jgi:hypothetical protein
MVNLKDCRNLEERMFYLGSHCKPLPSEPAPINREYFNVGLIVYSETIEMRGLKRIIDYAKSQINSDSKTNDEMKELAENTFERITNKYENICSKLSDITLPLISKSPVVAHIRSWVDNNYKIIKDLDMKQLLEKYDSTKINTS